MFYQMMFGRKWPIFLTCLLALTVSTTLRLESMYSFWLHVCTFLFFNVLFAFNKTPERQPSIVATNKCNVTLMVKPSFIFFVRFSYLSFLGNEI